LLALLDRLENERFLFRSHSLERAQASGLRRLGEFIDTADVERRVEQCNRFWTDALQAQQVEDRWRKFQKQILMEAAGARLGEFTDFFRQVFADARQLEQLLFVHPYDWIAPRTYRVRPRPRPP